MCITLKKTAMVIIIIAMLMSPAYACKSTMISGAEHEGIVSKIALIIGAQFANREIAKNIEAELKAGIVAKKFSHEIRSEEFELKLTNHLRALSGDNHIGLVCDPSAVQRYQAREKSQSSASEKTKDEQNRSQQLAESRVENFGVKKVELKNGDIGYLEMSYFDGHINESKPIFEGAMNLLFGAKAIILDLRRNGGGNSRILPLFLSYFIGPKPTHFATQLTPWKNEKLELFTLENVNGPRFWDKPIYILISGTTFSLAEHVTYHLRAFQHATVIGERSYGGGRAFDPVVIDDRFFIRLPRIEITNALTNAMYEEGKGIVPDVPTTSDDAPNVGYQLAIDDLLKIETDDQERSDLEWLSRTAKSTEQNLTSSPALQWREAKTFGEFKFEIRNINQLWMSFRGLPWVRLQNLVKGYFYDDRSIQRQFAFHQSENGWQVEVHRWGEKKTLIPESP
jgi:hypothetical protein